MGRGCFSEALRALVCQRGFFCRWMELPPSFVFDGKKKHFGVTQTKTQIPGIPGALRVLPKFVVTSRHTTNFMQ